MNVTTINNLPNFQKLGMDSTSAVSDKKTGSFDNLFQSMVNQVNETNNYSNAAEQEELNYSLGLSNNTSDLMVAQQKANLSLQYTVAIRNHVLDAYKEIMNLQF